MEKKEMQFFNLLGTFYKFLMEFIFISNKIAGICLFGFYGISTFVGYLIPNQFLYK